MLSRMGGEAESDASMKGEARSRSPETRGGTAAARYARFSALPSSRGRVHLGGNYHLCPTSDTLGSRRWTRRSLAGTNLMV